MNAGDLQSKEPLRWAAVLVGAGSFSCSINLLCSVQLLFHLVLCPARDQREDACSHHESRGDLLAIRAILAHSYYSERSQRTTYAELMSKDGEPLAIFHDIHIFRLIAIY